MDPNTGRLRSLSPEEFDMISSMKKSDLPKSLKSLEPLSDDLQEEAEKELAGRKETFIDLKSNSNLAKWAAKKRRDKKKIKRKMAKKSKRINRK